MRNVVKNLSVIMSTVIKKYSCYLGCDHEEVCSNKLSSDAENCSLVIN